ncbi:MAG: hypothetical protein MZU95_05725 [Desulfomicrobium escambiense]|nr:hypothetical protein [Desulfomicrobium escambiense]
MKEAPHLSGVAASLVLVHRRDTSGPSPVLHDDFLTARPAKSAGTQR